MSSQLQILYQLLLAIFLGGLIGLEREYKGKEAGLQTYSLVCLGAYLFTVIAEGLLCKFNGANISFDPSRIVQAIAVGVGFMGAGVIFREKAGVRGLTTAAGLWVSAAIGIAVGIKFYFLALCSTALVILLLWGFGRLERKIFKKRKNPTNKF